MAIYLENIDLKNHYFYHLVDSQARACVDLRNVAGRIVKCISFTFPEAENIEVRRGFYTFSLPATAACGLTGRLQKLGRNIARQLPALCALAMLHYPSDKHQDSKQLFKRVASAKAVKACLEELRQSL